MIVPRFVLDTTIITSAFRSRLGASRAVIDALDQSRFELLLSTPLLYEYEDVLTRPEQMTVHGFTLHEISAFLDQLTARAIRVTFHFHWKPQLRDPGDEHVLATAINGAADAIVTHNVRDFLPAAARFGIKIVTPGRIIKTGFSK